MKRRKRHAKVQTPRGHTRRRRFATAEIFRDPEVGLQRVRKVARIAPAILPERPRRVAAAVLPSSARAKRSAALAGRGSARGVGLPSLLPRPTDLARVCLRRQRRREVLAALGRHGRGNKVGRHTWHSKVRC